MRLLDPDITLDARSLAAWRDFRRDMASAGYSAWTERSYADTLGQLATITGGDVLGCSRADIQDYLIALSGRCAKGTVATRFRRLAHWFAWCAGDQDAPLIEASPMAGMKRPAAEEKAPAILGEGQLAAILAACRAPKGATAAVRRDAVRDRAIIMIMCQAACPRASEIAGLTLADADLEHDMITVRGKGGVHYSVGLEPAAARAVSLYLRMRPGYPAAAREAAAAAAARPPRPAALWLGKAGPMTRSGLAAMLSRRAAAAGVGHVHPHQFRHTAFDRSRAAGLLPHQAQRLNGWKSQRMCEVYGRAADGREAVAAGRAMNLAGAL
jgi:integrase